MDIDMGRIQCFREQILNANRRRTAIGSFRTVYIGWTRNRTDRHQKQDPCMCTQHSVIRESVCVDELRGPKNTDTAYVSIFATHVVRHNNNLQDVCIDGFAA